MGLKEKRKARQFLFRTPAVIKSHGFSIALLISILTGSLLGLVLQERAEMLKPLGDIFLNLLFTAVVPLVFFSISSAVSGMSDKGKLGKVLFWMLLIFAVTGIASSLLMVTGVTLFPPAVGGIPAETAAFTPAQGPLAGNIISAFTVSDFSDLLSKKNMLALIFFALLVGLAASSTGEKGRPFTDFLAAGNEVMMKVISLIMLYAPVGLGAYFAYLVGVFGPQLLGSYLRAMLLYYPLALFYFFGAYSLYAYLAGGRRGFRSFWSNILTPSLTSLATGSSLAAVPVNLEAADRIGVPRGISRIVIPIGASIHMDGTCLSAILKISVLFNLFGWPFSGFETIVTAIAIALLSGMVMGGIPGGGFLGELLIVTLYGFPPEALPLIAMVGTLVDPPATMVNSVGDNVTSMLVARRLEGRHWMNSGASASPSRNS